jgi:hypothetical protein
VAFDTDMTGPEGYICDISHVLVRGEVDLRTEGGLQGGV